MTHENIKSVKSRLSSFPSVAVNQLPADRAHSFQSLSGNLVTPWEVQSTAEVSQHLCFKVEQFLWSKAKRVQ